MYNKIHHLNKKIKQSLLDQSIISGLGNIYVDEVNKLVNEKIANISEVPVVYGEYSV